MALDYWQDHRLLIPLYLYKLSSEWIELNLSNLPSRRQVSLIPMDRPNLQSTVQSTKTVDYLLCQEQKISDKNGELVTNAHRARQDATVALKGAFKRWIGDEH